MVKESGFVEVRCAFCKGAGTDQFDVMSPLSTCVVCGGKGVRQLREPVVRCAFCEGSGVYPHTRLTCTACGGVGTVSSPENSVTCSDCDGSGVSQQWPDSPFYCICCHGSGVLPDGSR